MPLVCLIFYLFRKNKALHRVGLLTMAYPAFLSQIFSRKKSRHQLIVQFSNVFIAHVFIVIICVFMDNILFVCIWKIFINDIICFAPQYTVYLIFSQIFNSVMEISLRTCSVLPFGLHFYFFKPWTDQQLVSRRNSTCFFSPELLRWEADMGAHVSCMFWCIAWGMLSSMSPILPSKSRG